jgi:cytochrome c-type biogenesis protein CcmH
MTLFGIVCALLVAAALALVARPLWRRRAPSAVSREAMNAAVYRDQLKELDADLAAGTLARPDYDIARQELERRVLEDFSQREPDASRAGHRAAGYWLAALPLIAVGIYFMVGNPGAVALQEADQVTQHQIEGMVGRLAAKLKDNPDDVEGWTMLGRSYAVLGRYRDAADAYAKAAARAPRDAQLLTDFADVLAMANGQTLAGDPEKLIERALQIDPRNLKALALSGTAAYDRGDYRVAAERWGRMLPLVPADSEDARVIRENVAQANAKAGVPAGKDNAGKAKAAPATRLAGSVSLSPGLKNRAAPEDTVFIFARASEGPPLPLAVLRKQVRDLPLSFTLDDSMAMAAGMNLSAFPKVVVSARVSKSGGATPQAGDLQGASPPVANNASGVKIVIDAVVGAK